GRFEQLNLRRGRARLRRCSVIGSHERPGRGERLGVGGGFARRARRRGHHFRCEFGGALLGFFCFGGVGFNSICFVGHQRHWRRRGVRRCRAQGGRQAGGGRSFAARRGRRGVLKRGRFLPSERQTQHDQDD